MAFCRPFKGRGVAYVSNGVLPLPKSGEVQVWSARLVSTGNGLGAYHGMLSADERKKSASFIQERDRNRFIIARGILRELLGDYLGILPEQVRFSYGAYGKPRTHASLVGSGLQFNLSHADNAVVYAFSSRAQVGIDIEPLHQNLAWWELAPIVFSRREQAELAKIPEAEKAQAFLRGWTRKEAVVKGCGAGLSLDLKAFDVPLGRLENPVPVYTAKTQKPSPVWWLCPIHPLANFAAALVVNGLPPSLITSRQHVPPMLANLNGISVPQFIGAMPPSRLEKNPPLLETIWKI